MLSVRTLCVHFQYWKVPVHHKLPFLCVPLSTYPCYSCIAVSQFLLVSSSSLNSSFCHWLISLSWLYITSWFFFLTSHSSSILFWTQLHATLIISLITSSFSSQWPPAPCLCLTLPVASSSCPAISRARAALTFPDTSLSSLVRHLRLYSLLPLASPSSSCSLMFSVHILFLLLHLSAYQGEKHWEKSKDNFSVLISIFSTAIVCRSEERELQGKNCFIPAAPGCSMLSTDGLLGEFSCKTLQKLSNGWNWDFSNTVLNFHRGNKDHVFPILQNFNNVLTFYL